MGRRTMARALGPGTIVPRRRAFFGLLDADGWAWAGAEGRSSGCRHHPDARLHPRSGVLLHGQPDDRPRRPRLVADQPVPAREQVAAVSGAGRRGRARGTASPPELALPGRPHRRHGRPGRDEDPVRRRVGRDDRPGRRCTSPRPSAPATSARGRTARRCPSRAPMPAVVVGRRHRLRDRRLRCRRASRRRRSSS